MRPASLSRQLLRKLRIEDVRRIVDYYDLARARSNEEMIDGIVRRVGTDLSRLVSQDGPLSIDEWNAVAYALGGQARRSFDAVRAEFARRLDRVVAEFDVDEPIVELRDNPPAVRRLAQLLDHDREDLARRLQSTHGRTLLGRFIDDLPKRTFGESMIPSGRSDDWDDDPASDHEQDETPSDAPTLLVRLLRERLNITELGSAWPARGTLSINDQSFAVAVYGRTIGGSARGNSLERRFQNPSQKSPIVDDPTRHELLLGLWTEQGEDRAVIVAFDVYRRVGRTTRFSMFMPMSLLEQAADTGFATHENNKGETLYAFRPENIGRYVQTLIDSGLWLLDHSGASHEAQKSKAPQATVDTLAPSDGESIYIRPRVGMYAAFARLNYKPWFALAEFVDNSIQSFLRLRTTLVAAGHDGPLVIDVNLDDNEISVTDRAGGIAWNDFPRAFSPAAPPDDASGLSEFGLGMKAAACWFARRWSVRTSALGEAIERTVTFDIPTISRDGLENLPIETRPARDSDHFTVVTMNDLRVHPRGRTLTKIKEHLASIYRVLTKDGVVKLRLTTSGKTEELGYEQPELLDAPYYRNRTGPSKLWRREFEIDFGDKKVTGWAGILRKGSHAAAGFSVFRRRRLIEGSVGETYKPQIIFGSPNSFAYQRVAGEIFVEGFDVTHTKDGIQWQGYDDEVLESIRRQIDSPPFPLLDQADGYRVRKTADDLPTSFGADALSDVVEALSQPSAASAIRDQIAAPPGADAPVSEPPAAAPIVQQRDLKMQVVRDGRPWRIHLELVRDGAAAAFYSTSSVTVEGEEVLAVKINLEHDFSIAFINDNESVLQPIMRLVAALALGERVARESGIKNAGTVRHQANTILRTLAIEGGR
jgi:Histidine kinase-, DNA gyrase B-, and HSP90-like ATPase